MSNQTSLDVFLKPSYDSINNKIFLLSRGFAYVMIAAVFLYLINNYLVFWQGWPGTYVLFSHMEWFGLEPLDTPLTSENTRLGWIQFSLYLTTLIAIFVVALKTKQRSLYFDAHWISNLSAYIIRVAFWSVVLIGMVDTFISVLRIENMLHHWVSADYADQLGRQSYRGTYVHFPLIVISMVISWFIRSVSFSWLALMVVLAEFGIVVSRFVFSYEQAYMGDLVRFWYAALFLFASAYTLIEEGHVRVDVLYANFTRKTKAWTNTIGILFLGIPICWVILMQSLSTRGSSVNGPLLNFEVSQSGYGLYIKYLMAVFLIIFAVSMLIQFVSFLLYSIADLLHDYETEETTPYNKICSIQSR